MFLAESQGNETRVRHRGLATLGVAGAGCYAEGASAAKPQRRAVRDCPDAVTTTLYQDRTPAAQALASTTATRPTRDNLPRQE
jgi:hypothetical protein